MQKKTIQNKSSHIYGALFTFTFNHLADAFIQSNTINLNQFSVDWIQLI